MLKKIAPIVVAALWPLVSFADIPTGPGLSGYWQGYDGNNMPIEGQFYLTQNDVKGEKGEVESEMKSFVSWYGEQRSEFPDWATLFHGEIHDDGTMSGHWTDVPKGKLFRNSGFMELKIDSPDPKKACVLTVTKEEGADFGPVKLVRSGSNCHSSTEEEEK